MSQSRGRNSLIVSLYVQFLILEPSDPVNQKVVNALKLKTVRTERLKIATFGDQNQELEAVNLVELSLTKSGTDFKTTLNAFAVPQICNDLQGQDWEWVKKRYLSSKNNEFADVCPASNTMQIG